MNILVIGANGGVGSLLVQQLAKKMYHLLRVLGNPINLMR